VLRNGLVIPAHPLALTHSRKFDERRQRALSRYYIDAGAGGLAVGVHTTQFRIHDPKVGLLRPVLGLAAETARTWPTGGGTPVLVAGVVGDTLQAVREAILAHNLGYDVALLSLAGMRAASDAALLKHVRIIADIMPVMGFYLQPAVGGQVLDYAFWRAFAEIDNVVAIKIAPFNRYATLDVIRAVVDAGRARDIALYTGNDDHILLDLLTRHEIGGIRVRMVGGLLGQWACWTRTAVAQHRTTTTLAHLGSAISSKWLSRAAHLTDANGAIFDAANQFRGCIPGIHEILRRQGLLVGRECLDPSEQLSPGQVAEIDRVCAAYPELADDSFVAEGRDRWLA
jgi:dihydrodipicolinate synthase/N-acetylneuraminate lyase